jgi:hypothetical protein
MPQQESPHHHLPLRDTGIYRRYRHQGDTCVLQVRQPKAPAPLLKDTVFEKCRALEEAKRDLVCIAGPRDRKTSHRRQRTGRWPGGPCSAATERGENRASTHHPDGGGGSYWLLAARHRTDYAAPHLRRHPLPAVGGTAGNPLAADINSLRVPARHADARSRIRNGSGWTTRQWR